MKSVNDVMTRDVRVARPADSIRDAAAAMAQADIGSLPVGENDRLVGMITDRDIVLRATALGLGPETLVRDVMERVTELRVPLTVDTGFGPNWAAAK